MELGTSNRAAASLADFLVVFEERSSRNATTLLAIIGRDRLILGCFFVAVSDVIVDTACIESVSVSSVFARQKRYCIDSIFYS